MFWLLTSVATFMYILLRRIVLVLIILYFVYFLFSITFPPWGRWYWFPDYSSILLLSLSTAEPFSVEKIYLNTGTAGKAPPFLESKLVKVRTIANLEKLYSAAPFFYVLQPLPERGITGEEAIRLIKNQAKREITDSFLSYVYFTDRLSPLEGWYWVLKTGNGSLFFIDYLTGVIHESKEFYP